MRVLQLLSCAGRGNCHVTTGKASAAFDPQHKEAYATAMIRSQIPQVTWEEKEVTQGPTASCQKMRAQRARLATRNLKSMGANPEAVTQRPVAQSMKWSGQRRERGPLKMARSLHGAQGSRAQLSNSQHGMAPLLTTSWHYAWHATPYHNAHHASSSYVTSHLAPGATMSASTWNFQKASQMSSVTDWANEESTPLE